MGKKSFNATCTFTVAKNNIPAKCEAAISHVATGTKKATTKACQDILDISNSLVPVDTGTLKKSGYFEVTRQANIVSYRYEGVVGYGGNGDPINPKTGKHASEYMVQVHEDLNQPHPNGGQAKFLEEAVQQYAQQEFPRTVAQYIRDALSSILGGD